MATNEEIMDVPQTSKLEKKKPKRGIIYLSSIPPYFNVTKIRETFGEFGKVERVYLELADKESKPSEKKSKKRKVAKKFIEGWVEFERKYIAKEVARLLNNTQVNTRKSSKHYDCMWNIKYLSGFKWTHLHERLAYEKAAKRQKLRAEIHLAKTKTNTFTLNLHKKNKIGVNNLSINRKITATNDDEIDAEDIEDRKRFLSNIL